MARRTPVWAPADCWPRLVVWVSVTLGVAAVWPVLPAWLPRARILVLAAWGALGAAVVGRWWRRPEKARLAPRLAGLAGACVLAIALSAVQLLPVLEFAARSARVGEDVSLDVFRFSLEPYRLLELVWPKVFGTLCPQNRAWLRAILPTTDRESWMNSLFMGSKPEILALAAEPRPGFGAFPPGGPGCR